MELARKLPTGRISTNGNSLDTLHRLFTGLAHNGAHRAMGDCQATEVVLRGLLAHMFPDGMPGEAPKCKGGVLRHAPVLLP